MKFAFRLPDAEETVIEFYRSSFWGSVWIKANDRVVFSQSAFNLAIHFSLSLTRHYEFSLPGSSPRDICITKERPLFLAGFRSNRYCVSFNGHPLAEHAGY
jgi:hypothetical protein